MKALRELSLVMSVDNVIINENTVESIVDYHCKEFVNQWPQLKRYRQDMDEGLNTHFVHNQHRLRNPFAFNVNVLHTGAEYIIQYSMSACNDQSNPIILKTSEKLLNDNIVCNIKH